MPIESVTAPWSTSMYATAPVRAPKQSLDGEVFLSLLVTQLRNQDPSSPMNTNEMIGQSTQLAMMEQLTSLTSMFEESFSLQMRSAATQLLGRTVGYLDEAGEPVTGTVEAISFSGPVPTVTVGGVELRLDALTGVGPHAASIP